VGSEQKEVIVDKADFRVERTSDWINVNEHFHTQQFYASSNNDIFEAVN
jgi:hypothetical protein